MGNFGSQVDKSALTHRSDKPEATGGWSTSGRVVGLVREGSGVGQF